MKQVLLAIPFALIFGFAGAQEMASHDGVGIGGNSVSDANNDGGDQSDDPYLRPDNIIAWHDWGIDPETGEAVDFGPIMKDDGSVDVDPSELDDAGE